VVTVRRGVNLKVKLLVCFVLLLAGVMPSANAAIIFLDGFNHTSTPPIYTFVPNGGTINGVWTAGGAGVDWIGTYWTAFEGNGSLDMSSTGAGSVSTTLPTVAGQIYDLTFYMSGNPDGGDTIKDLQVTVGNLNANYTFDITGISKTNMAWILKTGTFIASGNDVLTFTSLDSNSYGPALDLVTVSNAVPEPASFLLGFAGLTALAFLRRKR